MTHISHPYSIRLGIIRNWKSRWFNRRNFKALLQEDVEIRDFLNKRLKGMFVDGVEIERSPGNLVVIIKTARPGLLIGRGGEGVEKLKKELQNIIQDKKTKKTTLKIDILEVKSPESHANVMVEQIVHDLEKRLPFRRVLKQNLSKISSGKGVLGVKIALAGRLDGSEMARREWLRSGRIPLQTLRADIDFARGRAHLPYGDIGIKVWIYRGEIF
ncbi:MAG TPA: 30S ribosomal protein S3 [Candidatus Paceibacterota bacterium]